MKGAWPQAKDQKELQAWYIFLNISANHSYRSMTNEYDKLTWIILAFHITYRQTFKTLPMNENVHASFLPSSCNVTAVF